MAMPFILSLLLDRLAELYYLSCAGAPKYLFLRACFAPKTYNQNDCVLQNPADKEPLEVWHFTRKSGKT